MKNFEIEGYEIKTRIGESRRSAVYRAVQTSLGRTVALKVLNPLIAQDPVELARFKLKSAATNDLRDANIAMCYGAECFNGLYYVSYEFVAGTSLDRRMHAGRPLATAEILIILRSAAAALESAWNHGELLHLNLKPSNVLIGNDGIVKLVDFSGLTASSSETLSKALDFKRIQNAMYLPPEIASDWGAIDFRADIYALGALCYQMLTGKPPLAGNTPLSHGPTGMIANPLNVKPTLSTAMAILIRKMMIIDPAGRYQSWEALNEDIALIIEHQSPSSDRLIHYQSAVADYVPTKRTESSLLDKVGTINITFLRTCIIIFVLLNIYLLYLLLGIGN